MTFSLSLRSSLRMSAAIALVGTSLLVFQNCSPTQFAQAESLDLAQSLEIPDSDLGDEDSAVVPVTDILSDCIDLLPITAPTDSLNDEYLQQLRGGYSLSSARYLSLIDASGSVMVGYAEVLVSAQNIKGSFTGRFGTINRLVDVIGPVCVAAERASELQNLAGSVTLVGLRRDGELAEVGRILDARAGLKVKDAHIGLIQNTRGPMLLENVEVDEIFDHEGDIVLVNSHVGLYRNIRGKISTN